ncbi:RNase P subunit p30 family protein [Candidatus Micrarchaeota archaeon]|nr:RNase P subunit p30 family protein [Candidatus Micrarchaeota archaeon]MBU1166603.1 RNase P subunit p30 family protein [Candidatus Micrarchaeota archaeon]MBU1887265.1 RNase P subunit p30 family protein [Candidatus Micrarchaeota archaeon]
MYDIIKCNAKSSEFGFANFYSFSEVRKNIADAENLKDAVRYKNRSTLVTLKDHSFDDGAVKIIAEKSKMCFLINIGEIIRTRGIRRAILISRLRTFLRICIKHRMQYAVASFAEKKEEIRTPDELCHICLLLGLNRGQGKHALNRIQYYF